ncbi:hypothetical protein [Paenibacillus amylolyticus]|uniref:Uncharacterized protein n=1 Tax=Paenibacillus amylolyticus TaxID=1451 RepID=A0ABD8B2T1_PAEAM
MLRTFKLKKHDIQFTVTTHKRRITAEVDTSTFGRLTDSNGYTDYSLGTEKLTGAVADILSIYLKVSYTYGYGEQMIFNPTRILYIDSNGDLFINADILAEIEGE